jgi:hypothetical protein
MRRLVLLLAGWSAVFAGETHRVAGVIVDSETGSPIANASLALSPYTQSQSVMVTVSGADGGFSFSAPRGKFLLTAVIAGKSQILGEMSPFSGTGTDVITGPDQDTAHLVFRWRRPAVVAGRVMDDQGEPVEGATVQLFYPGVANGHKQMTEVAHTSTDDRGEYRLWGIPGAEYYLEVTAEPWWRAESPVTYGLVYYPGTSEAARAALLSVQPGGEAHADFTLTARGLSNVTIYCGNCGTGAAGEAGSGAVSLTATAVGLGGTEEVVAAQMVPEWPFKLSTLPPGRYLVQLSGQDEANPGIAEQWVDVGPGETAVSLSLHPGAAVSGKVTCKGGSVGSIALSQDPYRQPQYAAVGPDGAFRITSVRAGKYHVLIPEGDKYPETIQAGNALLADGLVSVQDGVETKLSIVVNAGSGGLKGFAVRDGRPVANMLVGLVPTGAASGSPNQGWQTDSDGSFDWTTLRAGDYLLFAVDDPTIAYADAAAIKPYLAQAKAIRIEPGKVLEERVPVQVTPR